ncbi:uncharacterized protein CC84DRAFT_878856 [Paraphaeosphaeria sporulosa]|uniref:Secreted protein n=1 Tax=Paraphaeosphaeria sporulosa TaxID=1460663 RepID=A0A177C9C9_9PLEO|nr:uncharacterized protein CC84DRAFT_878856 [Paraphaeosphaeria sporulosa]OAG03986.1 hypothetical protein CC84DRAFT_878856 [Paraphaeosphaeria sporulosa]
MNALLCYWLGLIVYTIKSTSSGPRTSRTVFVQSSPVLDPPSHGFIGINEHPMVDCGGRPPRPLKTTFNSGRLTRISAVPTPHPLQETSTDLIDAQDVQK